MKKFFVLSVAVLSLAACSSTQEKSMDEAEAKDMAANAAEQSANMEGKKEEMKPSTGSKSSCTLDKDTRVIEVKKTEAGGCELYYTKFGEAKSVASSGFGTQYCEEVKDRIQSNLNKAGFACQ